MRGHKQRAQVPPDVRKARTQIPPQSFWKDPAPVTPEMTSAVSCLQRLMSAVLTHSHVAFIKHQTRN